MAQNNVTEILQAVVGELKDMARSETVIGEPVMAGDKTLVPVVTISVGFGAGGGQGDSTNTSAGFGGGGGAGLRIEPSAFIVLERDGVSLLPAKRGSWENLVNAIPNAVEKITKLRQDMRARQGSQYGTGSEYESYTGGEGQGGQTPGGSSGGGPTMGGPTSGLR